jgi:hypothetical protein
MVVINPWRQRLTSVPVLPRPGPSWCCQTPVSPSQHHARCQLGILPMVASCQLRFPKFRPQNHLHAPTEVFFLLAYYTSLHILRRGPHDLTACDFFSYVFLAYVGKEVGRARSWNACSPASSNVAFGASEPSRQRYSDAGTSIPLHRFILWISSEVTLWQHGVLIVAKRFGLCGEGR